MKCRSCGHEIAANAIVCYRCGTPTAFEPVVRQKPTPAASNRRTWVVVVVVVLVLAAAALAVGLARHLL